MRTLRESEKREPTKDVQRKKERKKEREERDSVMQHSVPRE